MRLHEFILTNHEQILEEWETFARTCVPASVTMNVGALRDHAREMLNVIATDILAPQNAYEQSEKAQGRGLSSTLATAAGEHGAGRAESGFTLEQMVAEYRALRASVLQLWTRERGELKLADLEDLIRFNEAIDQSLAESVYEFNQNVENAKELFLAMLGHDLRNPLGAIYSSAKFMLETGELQEPHLTLTSRISQGAQRMSSMVGDLLDFTRGRLGGGIPVAPAEANLGRIVRDVVDEISAAHPQARIQVDMPEEQNGFWDTARMSQALTNLVANAVEHAPAGTSIGVNLTGDATNVTIAIHNGGAAIPADALNGIFSPMKIRHSSSPAAYGQSGNLGLGLYITERVVHAHGGRIEVQSSEERGTTFVVHLPRKP
jgi:signal transduction histidine kinase